MVVITCTALIESQLIERLQYKVFSCRDFRGGNIYDVAMLTYKTVSF